MAKRKRNRGKGQTPRPPRDQEGFIIEDDNMRGPRITELLSRFKYADNYRQQFLDEAKECWKLYIGELDEKNIKEGRSNLFIPRTYEEIDTIRARIVKSFFSTKPYIDFTPSPTADATPETMEANSENGILAASILSTQFDRNNIVPTFYKFVTDFLVLPAAIMQVGWRYETREVVKDIPFTAFDPTTGTYYLDSQKTIEESVVWDDNEITNVNFGDFWADPRGKDIDSCRFVYHREFLTREQIENKLDLLEAGDWGTVYPIKWEEVAANRGSIEEGSWDFLAEQGYSPETTDDSASNGASDLSLYEVLHYWTDKEHTIILNRCAMAFDGDNPYDRHGKKPFVAACFEPGEGFYGLAAVKFIKHLQHELNTTRNQRIDNVSFVLNRMWMVRGGSVIDENELISRPHGVIHVNQPGDIEPLTTPDVTASSYNEENIIKSDMENVLGVPSVVRGVSAANNETATEVVTKSTNAGIRFDVKILVYESLAIERLAYLCDCNNQQLMDRERLARIYGNDGPEQWRMVHPTEIQGEWDYTPSGSNTDPAANREVRRQQFSQLMSVAMNLPMIKQYELVKLWLQTFDIRDINKVLYTEDEMAQMQAAAQQAQLEAQAAQADANAAANGIPTGVPGQEVMM